MSSGTPTQPVDPRDALEAKLEASLALDTKLPVDTHVDEFITMFRENQVLVISSATGFGKSTRIPQYVLREKLNTGLKIAVTQPRKSPALEISSHIASQLGEKVGATVGYQLRFEGKVDRGTTRIVFMTDGYLLAQASIDPQFSRYSTIIVDEAHERSTNTDILFVLLKRAMMSRRDLKVIILSDSPRTSKIQAYFNSGLFDIPGTQFPVKMINSCMTLSLGLKSDVWQVYCSLKDVYDYKESVVETLLHILKNKPKGDILVFLPGEKDIRDIKRHKALFDPQGRTVVTALYSTLPKEEQQLALEVYEDKVKIVLATNVAETSITVPNLVYVVDTGYVNSETFNYRTGMKELDKVAISQASAIQRADRVGQTEAGYVYRLYTWRTFNDCCPSSTMPAILTGDLAQPLLLLFNVVPSNPFEIDLIDTPTPEGMLFAIRTLTDLNLIVVEGGKVSLTQDGANASRLPLHPIWYNTIKEAMRLSCRDPVLTIVAIACADGSMYVRQHANMQSAVRAAKGLFRIGDSDHLTELNTVNAYVAASGKLSKEDLDKWCLKYFLSHQRLREIVQIRRDLESRVPQQTKRHLHFSDPEYWTTITKALARGLATHVAWLPNRWEPDKYKTVHGNHHANISAESCLVGLGHKWVVYSTASAIAGPEIQTVTAINPEWVIDLPYFALSRMPKKVGMSKYRMDEMAQELQKYRKI